MKRKWMMVGVALMGVSAMAWAKGKAKAPVQTVRAGKMTLTVGKPVTQGNLTVFPVYSSQPRKVGSEYLTLDEALKDKLISVKEMPSAEVNRVSVTSRANRPLYLMAGDIILGGQQDREVARDTIVPRGAINFVVEVFCVEHGRWAGGQHFGGNEIASSTLRRDTQRFKQQDKVWSKVAAEARKMKAETTSGTYRAVAGGQAAQQDINAYVKPLNAPLARDKRAVGIVVAINGEVTAADVFGDHKLFQKQLPKILKSYALDAVQEKAAWTKQPASRRPKPTVVQATQLLKDADRGQSKASGQSAATLNIERENESTIVFDAAAPSPVGPAGPAGPAGAALAPAHRNVFRKK